MSAMQRWGDAGRTPRVLAETRPDGATCIAALQYPMSEALNGVEYDPNPRRYNKSVAVYENTRASGGGSAQAVPRLDFGSLNTACGRRSAGCRSASAASPAVGLAAERHARYNRHCHAIDVDFLNVAFRHSAGAGLG